MGKRKESQQNANQSLISKYGMDFVSLSKEIPVEILLEIGNVVCGTDFAVYYYNNPGHPQFFKQDACVRKALRRCWQRGAFDHRETIARMVLERYVSDG